MRNAGYLSDEGEKRPAAHHLVEAGIGRPESREIRKHGLSAQRAQLVGRFRWVETWKFGHQLPAKFGIEKLVDHGVTERVARGELAVQLIRAGADAGR